MKDGINQFIVGAFALGLVTTLVLPGRQSVQLAGTTLNGVRGILATSMGTGKAV